MSQVPHSTGSRRLSPTGLDGLGSLPESVLKPARHVSQVPHSTGSRRLSPTGLDAPVVLSDLRGWVTARGAHLLLVVKRALSAPGTQRVRLVVALTERSCSLSDLSHGCRFSVLLQCGAL